MPTRAKRACSVHGCPRLTDRGRCDEHQQQARRNSDRHRGSSTARGYGAKWQRLRLHVLKRDGGLCQECMRNGRLNAVGKSGHVDHITPREKGGTDDESNLQTLCASCHSRKTAREDRGFGNAPQDSGE